MDLNIDTAALKRVAIEAGKAGLPFLEQALSAALVGIAGPFGMLVSPALNLLFPQINTMLGLDPDTPPDQTADKIASDPAAAATALDTLNSQQQFALSQQKQADDTQIASQAQQTALLALDTSAQSRFQRYWRPAVGWGLGALVMTHYGMPDLIWLIKQVTGRALDAFPTLDQTAIIGLFAMLGVTVASRSADKATNASAVKAIATSPSRRK